jgi:hypothetical protein
MNTIADGFGDGGITHADERAAVVVLSDCATAGRGESVAAPNTDAAEIANATTEPLVADGITFTCLDVETRGTGRPYRRRYRARLKPASETEPFGPTIRERSKRRRKFGYEQSARAKRVRENTAADGGRGGSITPELQGEHSSA